MTFQMPRNVPTKNSGYSVFNESGKVVYTLKSSGKKSVDAIAREVIQGKWGTVPTAKTASPKPAMTTTPFRKE